ncbi:hypothetical protein GOP47_0026747 [Adiantum capillus-veneris]|nr:hypothetical protein GOP47_0026747 [Adiantum capillus-veneris]
MPATRPPILDNIPMLYKELKSRGPPDDSTCHVRHCLPFHVPSCRSCGSTGSSTSHRRKSGQLFRKSTNQWSMTGRDPTPYEREYVGRKGLNGLMDILSSHGGMNLIDTPLGRDETSDKMTSV